MIIPPTSIELLRRLVELLVEADYEGAADLTEADRLPSHEIRWAIEQYGRTLVPIPANGWALLDAIAVNNREEGDEWSVRLPLWTADEGRSDLEVQATLRAVPDGRHTLRLDNILVP